MWSKCFKRHPKFRTQRCRKYSSIYLQVRDLFQCSSLQARLIFSRSQLIRWLKRWLRTSLSMLCSKWCGAKTPLKAWWEPQKVLPLSLFYRLMTRCHGSRCSSNFTPLKWVSKSNLPKAQVARWRMVTRTESFQAKWLWIEILSLWCLIAVWEA